MPEAEAPDAHVCGRGHKHGQEVRRKGVAVCVSQKIASSNGYDGNHFEMEEHCQYGHTTRRVRSSR